MLHNKIHRHFLLFVPQILLSVLIVNSLFFHNILLLSQPVNINMVPSTLLVSWYCVQEISHVTVLTLSPFSTAVSICIGHLRLPKKKKKVPWSGWFKQQIHIFSQFWQHLRTVCLYGWFWVGLSSWLTDSCLVATYPHTWWWKGGGEGERQTEISSAS